MARLNVISEGQPITYDVLNQIIQDLNNLQKNVPEDTDQNIEVEGPDIGRSDQDSVKIISGIKQFDIKGNDIVVNVDVKFPKGNFSKNSVVVVASVIDKNFGQGAGGGAQMANATITNISTNGFVARVQILKSVKKQVSLELHYIAIGAGPRNS